jgi:hypothetical protein
MSYVLFRARHASRGVGNGAKPGLIEGKGSAGKRQPFSREREKVARSAG